MKNILVSCYIAGSMCGIPVAKGARIENNTSPALNVNRSEYVPVCADNKINDLSITVDFRKPSLHTLTKLHVQDSNEVYLRLLQKYVKGKRDSNFLKQLTSLAKLRGDIQTNRDAVRGLLKVLKCPLLAVNLDFIRKNTTSTRDPGYSFILTNKEQINEKLGEGEAETFLKVIVESEFIKPFMSNTPDWDFLRNKVTPFGAIGEEAFLQNQMLFGVNNEDWDLLAKSITPWYTRFGRERQWLSFMLLNNVAWRVFQHIEDRSALEVARQMALRAVGMEKLSHHALDTYAQLLYKLGFKKEALIELEKVLSLARDDYSRASIRGAIRKIQDDLPTWPSKRTETIFTEVKDKGALLQKVKLENKYLMLAFVATWCGPCKEMDKYVYTDNEVGKLLNENFIAVKIQTDQTDKDNAYVKQWYKEVPSLMKKYGVNALPTLIFLSPEGKLVKRVVGGVDASGMIKAAKEALTLK
ncbi:thioredoxin family protein [Pedobacter deserti]|uniref:thioredoxin family protein n=1 Tax=Pedobacter deserti TaxID=2817382 RepID=UPI0021097744|nr:thioredoxin fold domain-containing protein [Pedobacter sp. SYSU D00382]